MMIASLMMVQAAAGSRVKNAVPRPTVVVFLSPDCPCNLRCKPELEELARSLRPILLTGIVVGVSRTQAVRYRAKLGYTFSLVPDPVREIAAKAGAACSLDMALLDPKGRPLRLWEGIGKDTVTELGREIGRRYGLRPIDPSRFSEITQTGCSLGVCYPVKSAPLRFPG